MNIKYMCSNYNYVFLQILDFNIQVVYFYVSYIYLFYFEFFILRLGIFECRLFNVILIGYCWYEDNR